MDLDCLEINKSIYKSKQSWASIGEAGSRLEIGYRGEYLVTEV